MRNRLLNIMGFMLILTSCNNTDTQQVTETRQFGEPCDGVNRCIAGLSCENGICHTLCLDVTDCNHMQTCQNGHCVNNPNNVCNIGWGGSNCDTCAEGFYGKDCVVCMNCGEHGHCSDGITGTGNCICDTYWAGEHCETKLPCADGFTGENCEQCLPGYFGMNCEPCTCKHGKCNDTILGDGFCREETCEDGFTGKNCNKCVHPLKTGENCDICLDPLKTGDNCDVCVNDHFTGENCNICKPQFDGENCDICAHWAFTGKDCNECAEGFTGENCDQCVNSKFTGPFCNECANPSFTGPNCDQCKYSQYTGENCSTCAEGYYGHMCLPYGSVTDRDGNVYRTVEIGIREWMAENLKTKTNEEGVCNDAESDNIGADKCFYVNNNETNTEEYGLFYNWETANNICPEGWRLPSEYDFQNLLGIIDMETNNAAPLALTLLKRQTVWFDYEGVDEFGIAFDLPGWTAFPENISYNDFNQYGHWWMKDLGEDPMKAKMFSIGIDWSNDHMNVLLEERLINFGASVRCVRDAGYLRIDD